MTPGDEVIGDSLIKGILGHYHKCPGDLGK